MKGKKTGGRKKGVGNKLTEEIKREAIGSGITPLQYMLAVMRDPKAKQARRDDMAGKAAPYVHPKLSSVEIGGAPDGEPVGFYMVGRLPKEKS